MDHIYIYAGSVSVAILMAKETTIFSWKSTCAMKWQHGHAEIHTLNRELSQKTCSIGPSSTGYGFGESWRCQRPSHCVSGNGELVVCPQLVNCGNPGSVVSHSHILHYFAMFIGLNMRICHIHQELTCCILLQGCKHSVPDFRCPAYSGLWFPTVCCFPSLALNSEDYR